MAFPIQFSGASASVYTTDQAEIAASDAAAEASATAAALSASEAATESAALITGLETAATDVIDYLAYLPLYPGALLFAGLPLTEPSSSGIWWIDGGVVSKS